MQIVVIISSLCNNIFVEKSIYIYNNFKVLFFLWVFCLIENLTQKYFYNLIKKKFKIINIKIKKCEICGIELVLQRFVAQQALIIVPPPNVWYVSRQARRHLRITYVKGA